MGIQDLRNHRPTAIVTGSSRGIGRVIALKLANAGYNPVVNYKESQTAAESLGLELEQMGTEYLLCRANVSAWDDVVQMRDQVLERWGHIDLLVNNAGIILDALFHKMAKEDWQQVIDTNLTGVFNCARVCVSQMMEQGYGKIINISSFVALKGNIGQANYAAAKAGIIGFSKTLALELAKYEITVNVIAPGFIETDMLSELPERIREKLIAQIPQRRFGTPEDIAQAVLYLAGKSGDYITGQVLNINGGIYM
ncbi:3-oxoacyl-[acyl-carrier-protein] reductase [Candidatus Bipolaricaulota bacterium]|nr:3-oxoacyl-[acyl-carrier-protein] reductase [Candidatus Bipolaricaulota bacterium]